MLQMFAVGFSNILNPFCFLLLAVGVILGLIFGCVPGLSTTMCLAVVMPISFTLSSVYQAFSLLMGAYIGGASGGCISAILLGIPGTPSSVATTFDGYPLAERGEAGKAVGVAVLYSFIGTLLGFIALVTISQPLGRLGLLFGNREFFALGVLALTIIASVCKGSFLKGLGAAAVGMGLSLIGIAPVDSAKRFTFGIKALNSGIKILTIVIGFYAMGAILQAAEGGREEVMKKAKSYSMRGFGISMKEFIGQLPNMFRSAIIGIIIGILPGMGGNIANLVAYSVAKSRSKYPEAFGTGIIDGIVASETSNNAVEGGSLIPMLTLGIPGSNATALLMSAFAIFGLSPGPMLFSQKMDVVYSVYVLMLIAAFFMLVIVLSLLPVFVRLLSVPKYYLYPVILLLCVVGVYANSHMMLDIWLCLAFGAFSFLIRKMEIPIAPLIVAFILTPTIEINLRRGLMAAPGGRFSYFFRSPIVCAFLIATVVVVAYTVFKEIREARKATRI